ncbi:DUF6844 domain-containing protein [Vibrio jasicida]|uniref:DUF6844 domain-containing protein n=1 Tax=Vibrio jasicida TaxID=766224 RepID=UPI00390989EC
MKKKVIPFAIITCASVSVFAENTISETTDNVVKSYEKSSLHGAPESSNDEPKTISQNALDMALSEINNWKTDDEIGLQFSDADTMGLIDMQSSVSFVRAESGAHVLSSRQLTYSDTLNVIRSKAAIKSAMDKLVSTTTTFQNGLAKPDESICAMPEDLRAKKIAENAEMFVSAYMADELRKRGVPEADIPEKVKNTPTEKKYQTFEDGIAKNSFTKAEADTTAYIPVQTFETIDDSGRIGIGAIMITSKNIRRLVNSMNNSKGQYDFSNAKRVGTFHSLNDLGYKSLTRYAKDQALSGVFGARLVYDNNGTPTIVSIGQSAPVSQFALSTTEDLSNSKQAIFLADSASTDGIAEFLNSETKATFKIDNAEKIAKYATARYMGCDLVDVDKMSMEKFEKEVGVSVKIESVSRVSLKGVKQGILSNVYTHPEFTVTDPKNGNTHGAKVFYSVSMWSPILERQQLELEVSHHEELGGLKIKALPTAKPGLNSGSNSGQGKIDDAVNAGNKRVIKSEVLLKPSF